MSHRTRSLRLSVVGLALLALLVLVSLGSRGGVTSGSDGSPTPGYVDWAMSVFLLLFACMIPFAAYMYVLQAREVVTRQERRSFQARVTRGLLFVGVLALVALIRLWFGDRFHFHPFGHNEVSTPPGATAPDRRPRVIPYEPSFKWPVLWAFLVLLAAGAALWWFKLRRRTGVVADAEAPSVAEEVAASIGDALDDLAAEPDARRAVIAAYARMERGFARHGLQRRLSETPIEYLRRILLGLTSRSDAVSRLTALFEQAKFSSHEIDGAMKEEAIEALRAIRDDLQAATA